MSAPANLSEEARAIWDAMVEGLPVPVSTHNYEMFGAYCRTKARMLEAEEYLDEHGPTVTLRNDKGDPKTIIEAPQVRIAERARDALLEISRRLKLKGEKS